MTYDQILEYTAVSTCIIGCYLAAVGSIWNFVVSSIMALIYMVIDYRLRIYADMTSQVVFIGFQIYGWYQWTHNKSVQNSSFRYAPLRQCSYALLLSFLLSLIYAYILHYYTNSTLLPLDISTTVLSYVALWMLAKQYIQTWWIWIIVNGESVLLYFLKGYYLAGLQYLVLLGIACYGAAAWASRVKLNTRDTGEGNELKFKA